VLTDTHAIPTGTASLPFNNFRFGSVRHLDEPADGTWMLTVSDESAMDTGTFKSWSLTFRGH
jgi:subtilisin-like proprotein convertase family protein